MYQSQNTINLISIMEQRFCSEKKTTKITNYFLFLTS